MPTKPHKTKSRRTAVAATAAICLALAAGGCGSSSTDSYKKNFKTAAENFKNSAQQAQQQTSGATTPQGRIQGLDALKSSVNKAADDFAKLKPPSNAKSDNDALVAELRSLGNDIQGVESAVSSKDQSKAQQLLPALQNDQMKISATLQQLKSKVGS